MNHDRYTELQAKRDKLEAEIIQARAIALTNEVLRMEIEQ